jgi:P-type Ca2+ transporter type 2C
MARLERFGRNTLPRPAELGYGTPLFDIFFLAVALVVSAIPEGLLVALTVALSVAMRRMARRHVIIRRMVAAEALGSCTYIASDKSGTLTINELTVRRLVFPEQEPWEVTGEGRVPEGHILTPDGAPTPLPSSCVMRRGWRIATAPGSTTVTPWTWPCWSWPLRPV